MKVILSTNNPAKRLEIDAIFSGSKISLISLADAGIIGEAMEDGQTLQDNALKKALFLLMLLMENLVWIRPIGMAKKRKLMMLIGLLNGSWNNSKISKIVLQHLKQSLLLFHPKASSISLPGKCAEKFLKLCKVNHD